MKNIKLVIGYQQLENSHSFNDLIDSEKLKEQIQREVSLVSILNQLSIDSNLYSFLQNSSTLSNYINKTYKQIWEEENMTILYNHIFDIVGTNQKDINGDNFGINSVCILKDNFIEVEILNPIGLINSIYVKKDNSKLLPKEEVSFSQIKNEIPIILEYVAESSNYSKRVSRNFNFLDVEQHQEIKIIIKDIFKQIKYEQVEELLKNISNEERKKALKSLSQFISLQKLIPDNKKQTKSIKERKYYSDENSVEDVAQISIILSCFDD